MPPHSRWIPSISYGICLAKGPAILVYVSMFIPYRNSMEFEYFMESEIQVEWNGIHHNSFHGFYYIPHGFHMDL